MNKTLDYYNENVEKFIADTANVEFSHLQSKFLDGINSGGAILDFGCGSGRDSKAFKDADYEVVSVDGSIELAKAASELIGHDVICSYFQDFETDKRFDGIWACASLLHLQKDELPAVISKLVSYLKPSGKLYMSFKYGNFEGDRNGRYYTDFTEETMTKLFNEIGITNGFDYFITSDVRPGRGEEKWLNVFYNN